MLCSFVFAALALSTVIDHREWPVWTRRRDLDDVPGVLEDCLNAVLLMHGTVVGPAHFLT
jgi:hypothetical protein